MSSARRSPKPMWPPSAFQGRAHRAAESSIECRKRKLGQQHVGRLSDRSMARAARPERPAHAEEHHDHHACPDAGHEAAHPPQAASQPRRPATPSGSGQSLPGASRNPIRHAAAAYRVSAREPRRPGPDLSVGSVRPVLLLARRARKGSKTPSEHTRTANETAMTAEKGMAWRASLSICRRTVRAASIQRARCGSPASVGLGTAAAGLRLIRPKRMQNPSWNAEAPG